MASLVSFKNKLRKFSDLPANEMVGFVKYSVAFPFFLFVYRLAEYKRTRIVIERYINPIIRKNSSKDNKYDKNIPKIINYSVSNSIFKSTCLEQSLFTYLILGLNGVKSNMKIGVNKTGKDLLAHAWVEKDNITINSNTNSAQNFSAFQD